MRLFNQVFKNQKGFTLPEVLIAAGIMGGIAVALTFLMKQQADQSNRSNQDSALALAKSEILAMMANPANCNANLKSVAVSATKTPVTSLKTCAVASGNERCANALAPTDVIEKYPATDQAASWEGTGILDKRLKITKIERTVAPVSIPSCPNPPCFGLTTANLHITFTRRNVVQNFAGVTEEKFQPIQPEFVVPAVVVVSSAASTVVAGCPKSWNSTELY